MLTWWVVGVQYFVVGLFDFHRARAPDDYWILEALQAPIAWFVRLCCFVDLGTVAEQLHALASRRPSPVESGLERSWTNRSSTSIALPSSRWVGNIRLPQLGTIGLPLTLTASDIRAAYEAAARRSLRRAEYARQIPARSPSLERCGHPGNRSRAPIESRSRRPMETRLPSRPSSSGLGGAPARGRRRGSGRTTTASSY